MSARLRRNALALKSLAVAKGVVQQSMINMGSKDFIKSLVECAMNILKGNVPLKSPHYKRLKKYHKHLRELTKVSTSQKRRRDILQTGGFIGALLKPLIGLLMG